MADTVPTLLLNNNRRMPMLGLGTFIASSEVIEPMLDAALEAGYRHFDTSYWFCNEEAIGSTLRKWLRSGRVTREELFITCKLPDFHNRAGDVEQSLRRSLEALQLSYADLYLIEDPVGHDVVCEQMVVDMSTDHLSLWKAMEEQVDAGRARAIGLSGFNSRQVTRIVKAARIPPAVLQLELNVYIQRKELVGFCKALNMAVCAAAPLGSPDMLQVLKMAGLDISGVQEMRVLNDPVVRRIAEKHNKTAAQVLLRHIVQRGIAAIPKSMHACRIKENIQVFDFQLDDDDVDRLYVLDKGRKACVYVRAVLPGDELHPEFPFSDPF